MKDIFEFMHEKVGCQYISDLPYFKEKILNEMKKTDVSGFSKKMMEDFSCYVFQTSYDELKSLVNEMR